MTADVNDKTDRERVLDAALRAGNRVLLLTEGLLFYLPAETVRSLAREAAGGSRWILDISFHSSFQPPDCGEAMRQAHELRHETRLEGAEILETITASGWKAAESKTFMRDGVPFAAQRMARSGWSPDPNAPRPPADDPAGVWLFERAD
jgi:O-methyltransferase involved in polyketide biosynthesis